MIQNCKITKQKQVVKPIGGSLKNKFSSIENRTYWILDAISWEDSVIEPVKNIFGSSKRWNLEAKWKNTYSLGTIRIAVRW